MIGILVLGVLMGAVASGLVLAQGLSVGLTLFTYAAVGTASILAVPALCLARARFGREGQAAANRTRHRAE